MKKLLFTFVLGLFAIQLSVLNFAASTDASEAEMQAQIEYAPRNPTKAQVRAAAPTDIVVFDDPELERTVSEILKVSVGNIKVSDMSRLINISNYNGISDLTGLEYAVNLNYIFFYRGTISDLTPLSGLNNLETLDLTMNNISDITPLAGLKKLTMLTLFYNQVSDVTPLANLTNLTYLVLERNNITDITPLRDLTGLKTLFLAHNQITDISPISNMIDLETIDLSYNKITDISPVSNFKNLQFIRLTSNQITNIEPLSELTNLANLYANENQITDISPLRNLTLLFELDLRDNKISNIDVLSNLPKLYNLGLANNQISDISPIPPNHNLITIMDGQVINLPDLTVYNNNEIEFTVISKDGEKIPVKLGTPAPGENILSTKVSFSVDAQIPFNYDATITQKVTLVEKNWNEHVTINEGKELTDNELKKLFNLNDGDNQYSTNQSAVNYHTPGDYPVIFTSGTNTINGTLTINDVIPTITVANPTITIKLGDMITDYLKSFGITVTEITHGDLTASIIVDDSKVNYNKAGKHTVIFKITDAEGNTVEQAGNIVIEESSKITPEVPKSEAKSENKNEKVKSEVEVKEETSKKNKAMTLDDKKELTSTGFNTSLMMIILSITTIVLVVLKKIIVRKI